MDDLLFLAHRVPYPPDKGDKIRSWNILKRLAGRYRIHLGCFIDDPHDRNRDQRELRDLCAECWTGWLDPRAARVKSLKRLATGEALTLGYYHDPALAHWVRERVEGGRIRRIFTFCSSMAQYALAPWAAKTRRVFDYVDVDSDKWRQYATSKPWPASWIYRREGRTLLAFERRAAREADAVVLVSEAEAALFRELAPESAKRIWAVRNGVDVEFFDPARAYERPPSMGAASLVFTGAMDYWANVDGVAWFAREVLPDVRRRHPDATFWIVGANPTAQVRALAALPGVTVTGRVPDVRPYLAHAAAVVAPLRLARGVQNKVLEAMAMAKAVVATPEAAEGIEATPGRDLLVASGAAPLARIAGDVLDGAARDMGARARALVFGQYGWDSALGALENMLEGDPA
jgi:sugar transferase (PEP-CTERM/EpsH1 system associated)